jgi:hypothetical protein
VSAATSFDLPNCRPYRRNVGTRRAPNPTLELCPLSEMFNMRSGSHSAHRLLPGPLGVDPVEDHLQKLIAEYRAIEEMDRIVRSADPRNDTELIGLRVRELRRREILLELTKIIVADFAE